MVSSRNRILIIFVIPLQLLVALGLGFLSYGHYDEAIRWSAPGQPDSTSARVAFEYFSSVLTAGMVLTVFAIIFWEVKALCHKATGPFLKVTPLFYAGAALLGLLLSLMTPDAGNHHIDIGRGLGGLALMVISLAMAGLTLLVNWLLRAHKI